jgi:hypothetical protein
MLLHVDGSRHRWIPGLDGYQDMIVVFDDATSEMYYARLVEEESTETVMAALKQVIADRGMFCSLYTDRGVLCLHTRAGDLQTSGEDAAGTGARQMAVSDRGQQPGGPRTCERLFGTGKTTATELRRRICTVEAANAYLPD